MDELDRIRDVVSGEPDVLVAYVFGSVARDTANALSDVDVAVLTSPGSDVSKRHPELVATVADVTGLERADVLMLDEAPIALAYRVLRDGRLLFSRDDPARIAHWMRTVDRYIDMAPFRRTLEEGLSHRLAEGRFGRP